MEIHESSCGSVGVAVFVFRDKKFLMCKRQGSHGAGTWSVPGGKMDFGESPEETAEREVLEETGMKIRVLARGSSRNPRDGHHFTNDIFPGEGKHFITIWIQADWVEGEPQILEPEKCSEQRWVDFGSLPEPLLQPCWENIRILTERWRTL